MTLFGLNTLKKTALTFFSAAVVLAAPAGQASEASLPMHWEQLSFEGSKLFITLRSSVKREYITTAQAEQELISVDGQNPKMPSNDDRYVSKLTLTTSVLGNDSVFTVWQTPEYEVLQRTSLYTGIKDWYRTYRFHSEGAFSRKHKPASGESDKPWQEWSKINEAIYPYKPLKTDLPLSEAEAIFEALAQGHIKKVGDEFIFHIFDRDGTLEVKLNAVSNETIKVNYVHTTPTDSQKKKTKINALKVSVNGTLLEGDIGNSEFSFMGYKSGITLHMDPETYLPLKLAGKADYVGSVEIELEEAKFAYPKPLNTTNIASESGAESAGNASAE